MGILARKGQHIHAGAQGALLRLGCVGAETRDQDVRLGHVKVSGTFTGRGFSKNPRTWGLPAGLALHNLEKIRSNCNMGVNVT